MKYLTKQKRLVAIFDSYLRAFCKTSATMTEVSEWAVAHGLYPPPNRIDGENACFRWEKDLEDAKAATKAVQAQAAVQP